MGVFAHATVAALRWTLVSFLVGNGKGTWEAPPVGVVIQPERPWQRRCASRSLHEEGLPAVALILLPAGAYGGSRRLGGRRS